MGKKLFIAMIVIISTITLGILLYSKSGEIEILKENNNQKTIKEIRIERAIEEAKNKQKISKK